jgi:hypothetical protein
LFPPQDNCFTGIFAKDYRAFLETNATTDDGMQYVAKHYGVEAQWKSYLDGSTSQELKKVIIKIYCIEKCLLDLDPI